MKLRTFLLLLLLFVLWITPGLVGREPWKADEPYTYGIVEEMIRTGDWVVPTLTGEPFVEKPPIYFMTAALFGRMFSPPLELYDAARLATALFIFLSLVFIALAAGELYGREHMAKAVILLMGAVLLQETGHKLITDDALFCGFSAAFYGIARSQRRPLAGGFWLGTGAGLGFMAKGLLAPGLLGMTALALPMLFRQWRSRGYLRTLLTAAAAAIPWLVIWPVAFYRRSPDLFVHWLWNQNFGRFLGLKAGAAGYDPGQADSHAYYLLNILWLAWPAILPAGWTLWHFRRSRREHPAYRLPLVAFLVSMVVLSLSWTNRSLYAMPLVLPVTLMAVPALECLPVSVKHAANRLTLALFGSVLLVVWFAWFALISGTPAVLAEKLHAFQPDYAPAAHAVLLFVAVLYTAGWLAAALRIARTPDHFMLNWTLGIVLAWGLVMTLWLPALNSGSSFRTAFLSLRQSLPPTYTCVASVGLGESERAMLEHFTGIRTRRLEVAGSGDCDLLIEQRSGKTPLSTLRTGWNKVWTFDHPSVQPKDVFNLYAASAMKRNVYFGSARHDAGAVPGFKRSQKSS